MKAYSPEVRQKSLEADLKGEGAIRQGAKRYSVSRSMGEKLLKQHRATPKIAALPHGGGRSAINSSQEVIVAQVGAENNPPNLEELCEKLEAKAQVRVRRATMGRIIQKLNLTRRKQTFDADEATPTADAKT